MNPTRLRARNFRSWQQLDLELPSGCVAVIGPNGAGKSSLLGVIEVALFGGRLERLLTRGETELEIVLDFDHAGSSYRVRRHYSARQRGKSSLDLERDDASIAAETIHATQERIERILGVTRATWRASAYLAQGDAAAFTEITPASRKAILGEILGLDVWNGLLGQARSDLVRVATRVATLDAQITTAEQTAAESDMLEQAHNVALAELALHEDGLYDADRELDAAIEADARQREAAARYEAADRLVGERRAVYGSALKRIEHATALIRSVEEALAARAHLAARAASVGGLEEALAAAGEEQAQYRALQAEGRRAAHDLERLTVEATESAKVMRAAKEATARHAEPTEQCPTCGQPLADEEARRRAVAVLDEQATHRRAQYLAARETFTRSTRQAAAAQERRAAAMVPEPPDTIDLEAELLDARRASETLAKLTEREAMLDAARVALARDEAELAAASVAVAAAEQAVGEALRARGKDHVDVERPRHRVAELRRASASLGRQVTQLEGRLDHAVEASRVAARLHTERSEAADEGVVLEALERAFGRNGIPAMIVESSALPQIEAEASRILAALGTSYAVELRSQRPLKSGDAQRDTLDIVVTAPDGSALYEDFSGGEKMKVNLSLRIALARLLAHRRGADIRLLAIDEPEFLDEASVDHLAYVLHGLEPDFDRILLVSHIPALRESFDQVIEVERGAGDASVLAQAVLAS